MNQLIFTVVMAGGGGTRFWPLSRQERPKQLLNLSGSDIMLNETIRRMEPLVSREHAFVVTNEKQAALLKGLLLPEVERSHILAEPAARNTAPCILYAALVLHKMYGDGIMCVLPADHHIANEPEYRRVMEQAVNAAENSGQIVTVGIAPTYPATGYGYIACGKPAAQYGAFEVEAFVEKPCEDKARAYLKEGSYLWNSGVFVWKISTILKAFAEFLPEMYRAMLPLLDVFGTEREEAFLREVYPTLESISVDYGIMEKAGRVLVLKGDYGWSDVGSLDALPTFHETDADGNLLLGDVLALNSKDCILRGEDRLIAVVGVDNLMVIDTKDALLVCPKDRAQEVKNVVDILKAQERSEI